MFKKTTVRPGLEKAIDDALRELDGFSAEHPEYERITARLTELYAMRVTEKPTPKALNTEVWIGAAVNLAGIAMIINHERVGVITSKALGFVMKSKL